MQEVGHGPEGVVVEGGHLSWVGTLNGMGPAIEPGSLAGAVRCAHQRSGVPVLVTEHGMQSDDDGLREDFIPAALAALAEETAPGHARARLLPLDPHEQLRVDLRLPAEAGVGLGGSNQFPADPQAQCGAYAAAVREDRAARV